MPSLRRSNVVSHALYAQNHFPLDLFKFLAHYSYLSLEGFEIVFLCSFFISCPVVIQLSAKSICIIHSDFLYRDNSLPHIIRHNLQKIPLTPLFRAAMLRANFQHKTIFFKGKIVEFTKNNFQSSMFMTKASRKKILDFCLQFSFNILRVKSTNVH